MTLGADDPTNFNPPPEDRAAAIQEAAFDPDLIAHMVLCWDAQRDNADRLAKKVGLVLSALALLFGLGLYKIEWTADPKHVSRIVLGPWWTIWVIKWLFGVALLCFSVGLYRGVFGVRVRRQTGGSRAASDLLRFPEELMLSPPASDKESRAQAFYRLSKAIDELSEQNKEKAVRVRKCEFWFAVGMALVSASTLAYIVCSGPPF